MDPPLRKDRSPAHPEPLPQAAPPGGVPRRLPAAEDKAFRLSLRRGQAAWHAIHERTDPQPPGKVLDRFSVSRAPALTAEGYRLLWFHSTRKTELDAARTGRIQRAGRQLIEKRFSQLKTDFRVAPVYLKEVTRIQSLLCVYFLVLLVESLLERELRRAMQREGIECLPMYPEGRPTARRLIDLFDDLQRHTLVRRGHAPIVLFTELSPLQRRLLKLLGVPASDYGG